MSTSRWLALVALVAVSACLNPTREPDCLLDGTCECKSKADCAEAADCVDGHCFTPPDAGTPGELGWPCTDDSECLFGPCLPPGPGNGRVCSAVCFLDGGTGCDKGWDCKQDNERFLCTPPIRVQCLPCSGDADCNALGDHCSSIGDAGTFCTTDCTLTGQCAPGHVCRTMGSPDGGRAIRQCVPQSNTCECSLLSAGLTRACHRTNPRATCFGVETCQPDGQWSGCDAPLASQEICDGLDNDCDGLTDQADPELLTTGLPGYPDCNKGACGGKWSCQGTPDAGYAFSCSAHEPEPESCNNADDDCNGIIDDGLVDSNGDYVSVHACGNCATDCTQVLHGLKTDGGAVLDSSARCELRNGARVCIPAACEPGFYLSPPSDPQVCEPVVDTQCRPCTTSQDCSIPGDVCVAVGTDPEPACAQSCDVTSAHPGCTGAVGAQDCCPMGDTCQLVGGQKLCVPQAQSCQCTVDRLGATRSCFLSNGAATCVGRQTCTAQGYGVCDTSQTSVEVCDGHDNDCDGLVDENFINTQGSGTYDSDEHCGNCLTNCLARWSKTIQHANGACALVAGDPRCVIGSCTTQTVGGGGLCRVDTDCPGGLTCDPRVFQCVKSCTGTSGCSGADTCVDGRCQHVCNGNADCAAFGAGAVCTGGVCGFQYQFVDADQDDSNGCECASNSSVTDEPEVFGSYPAAGVPYVDRNCDGVDGVAATSLFVWAQSTSSQGTRSAPFKTIGEAIAAFRPGTHTAILVAQGIYAEQVVLTSGVKLYGGYASNFARRDVVLFPTFIEAAEPTGLQPRGTVNAENVTDATVVAGFTIRGYDVNTRPTAGQQATNSFAIYARNAPGLLVQNNHVIGGRGGDGTPAESGSAGASGGAGSNGLDARECATAHCGNESQTGGAPGTNAACAGATGGNPGAGSTLSNDPQQYGSGAGLNGAGGANATYGDFGGAADPFCKYDCLVPQTVMAGGAARNGPDGASTSAGLGCAAPRGRIVNGDWSTLAAGAGGDGVAGRGGGGGGAGGCVDNQNAATCSVGHLVGDLGATGGGGGAGGCGGGRGRAGAGGGASFAIFVAGAAPRLDGNVIDVGFGGIGGNGGAGGYGGLGGQGGRGGLANSIAWCAGQGGPGGRGGNGGAGSGGGGGCGGSVFGIAGEGIAGQGYGGRNTLPPAPTLAVGTGGLGGASPAGSTFQGGNGVDGIFSSVESF